MYPAFLVRSPDYMPDGFLTANAWQERFGLRAGKTYLGYLAIRWRIGA
ncbi:MAG TPA: hypothetical protein VFQ24_10675 [Terriglobia bacterium]|nr:hypothetical protein [Terriglobia bacterium]